MGAEKNMMEMFYMLSKTHQVVVNGKVVYESSWYEKCVIWAKLRNHRNAILSRVAVIKPSLSVTEEQTVYEEAFG